MNVSTIDKDLFKAADRYFDSYFGSIRKNAAFNINNFMVEKDGIKKSINDIAAENCRFYNIDPQVYTSNASKKALILNYLVKEHCKLSYRFSDGTETEFKTIAMASQYGKELDYNIKNYNSKVEKAIHDFDIKDNLMDKIDFIPTNKEFNLYQITKEELTKGYLAFNVLFGGFEVAHRPMVTPFTNSFTEEVTTEKGVKITKNVDEIIDEMLMSADKSKLQFKPDDESIDRLKKLYVLYAAKNEKKDMSFAPSYFDIDGSRRYITASEKRYGKMRIGGKNGIENFNTYRSSIVLPQLKKIEEEDHSEIYNLKICLMDVQKRNIKGFGHLSQSILNYNSLSQETLEEAVALFDKLYGKAFDADPKFFENIKIKDKNDTYKNYASIEYMHNESLNYANNHRYGEFGSWDNKLPGKKKFDLQKALFLQALANDIDMKYVGEMGEFEFKHPTYTEKFKAQLHENEVTAFFDNMGNIFGKNIFNLPMNSAENYNKRLKIEELSDYELEEAGRLFDEHYKPIMEAEGRFGIDFLQGLEFKPDSDLPYENLIDYVNTVHAADELKGMKKILVAKAYIVHAFADPRESVRYRVAHYNAEKNAFERVLDNDDKDNVKNENKPMLPMNYGTVKNFVKRGYKGKYINKEELLKAEEDRNNKYYSSLADLPHYKDILSEGHDFFNMVYKLDKKGVDKLAFNRSHETKGKLLTSFQFSEMKKEDMDEYVKLFDKIFKPIEDYTKKILGDKYNPNLDSPVRSIIIYSRKKGEIISPSEEVKYSIDKNFAEKFGFNWIDDAKTREDNIKADEYYDHIKDCIDKVAILHYMMSQDFNLYMVPKIQLKDGSIEQIQYGDILNQYLDLNNPKEPVAPKVWDKIYNEYLENRDYQKRNFNRRIPDYAKSLEDNAKIFRDIYNIDKTAIKTLEINTADKAGRPLSKEEYMNISKEDLGKYVKIFDDMFMDINTNELNTNNSYNAYYMSTYGNKLPEYMKSKGIMDIIGVRDENNKNVGVVEVLGDDVPKELIDSYQKVFILHAMSMDKYSISLHPTVMKNDGSYGRLNSGDYLTEYTDINHPKEPVVPEEWKQIIKERELKEKIDILNEDEMNYNESKAVKFFKNEDLESRPYREIRENAAEIIGEHDKDVIEEDDNEYIDDNDDIEENKINENVIIEEDEDSEDLSEDLESEDDMEGTVKNDSKEDELLSDLKFMNEVIQNDGKLPEVHKEKAEEPGAKDEELKEKAEDLQIKTEDSKAQAVNEANPNKEENIKEDKKEDDAEEVIIPENADINSIEEQIYYLNTMISGFSKSKLALLSDPEDFEDQTEEYDQNIKNLEKEVEKLEKIKNAIIARDAKNNADEAINIIAREDENLDNQNIDNLNINNTIIENPAININRPQNNNNIIINDDIPVMAENDNQGFNRADMTHDELVNYAKPDETKPDSPKNPGFLRKETYVNSVKEYNVVLIGMAGFLNDIKEELKQYQTDAGHNFDGEQMEGSQAYQNMTQSIEKAYQSLRNYDKNPSEIRKDLLEVYNNAKAYYEDKHGLTGYKHSDYGKVRLLNSETIKKKIPVLINLFDNARAGVSYIADTNNVAYGNKPFNEINAKAEAYTAEHGNAFDIKEFDDINYNLLYEKSVTQMKMKEKLLKFSKRFPKAYEYSKSIDSYLNLKDEVFFIDAAKYFTAKKYLDKVYKPGISSQEAEELYNSFNAKEFEKEYKALANNPAFIENNKLYGGKSLSKWKEIEAKTDKLIDEYKTEYNNHVNNNYKANIATMLSNAVNTGDHDIIASSNNAAKDIISTVICYQILTKQENRELVNEIAKGNSKQKFDSMVNNIKNKLTEKRLFNRKNNETMEQFIGRITENNDLKTKLSESLKRVEGGLREDRLNNIRRNRQHNRANNQHNHNTGGMKK